MLLLLALGCPKPTPVPVDTDTDDDGTPERASDGDDWSEGFLAVLDGDGVVNELTVADITAVALFQATLPVPQQVLLSTA